MIFFAMSTIPLLTLNLNLNKKPNESGRVNDGVPLIVSVKCEAEPASASSTKLHSLDL